MKRFIKKIIVITLLLSYTLNIIPVYALSKNETIFANLNKDGTINNVTISEELKDINEGEIKDKSNLANIKNINGSEKFRRENDSIIWENKGNNIYYQGTTKENLPITLDVKYYLNDKQYDIKDILGKKGRIKIVLKYSNNLKKTVIINNKATTLYTPFVVTTTTIIPNENNKNIKITNGKVMDNGNNSILVSLTSPGLYESLKVDKIKDFDTTIISYDTECFELSSIYSMATNKIIEENDLDIFKDSDKLYSSIDKLVKSSNYLVNGSEKILDGANKIRTGSNTLEENLNKAYNGSKTINEQVKKSIKSIKENNSEAIDDTTLKYIIKNAKETANSELESQKSYIINNAIEEANKAVELTDEQKELIVKQTLDTIKANNEYKELEENYNKYTIGAEQASNAYKQYMEAYEQYKENNLETEANEALEKANEYKAKMESAITASTTYKTMMTIMEETAKTTAINTASTVSKQVATLVAEQVADKLSTQITESVAEKVSEAVSRKVGNTVKQTILNQTSASLSTLSHGLEELTNGLNELDKGAKTLYDGTTNLTNGLKELNNGLNSFDNQGIKKINEIVNDKVKPLDQTIKALEKLNNEYETFDNKEIDTKGKSKIVLVIESAKKETKEKEKIQTTKLEKKKSLWEKIKDLFK